jgi:glycosyltransferase involved in cell wall biosynthesis
MESCNDGLSWLLGGIGRRIARTLGADVSMGWIRPAERTCSNLTPDDVDIILASGPPFSAFVLARGLAKNLHCPYVLDYRDLWSHNPYNLVPPAVNREASVIASSAAVTTVSPSWARVLDSQFHVGTKIRIVSNGYDPEHLSAIKPHDFGHFAIVYTGSLWRPKRPISPVMAALRRLRSLLPEQGQWMFHYYGLHGIHVQEEAERFKVTDRVIVHNLVPRSAVLEAVKGAGVAIVITSVGDTATPEDNGMVTAKIFEAIGLGTPILAIAPEGSDAGHIIERTGLGRHYPASDLDGIACFLKDLAGGKRLDPMDTAAFAWRNLVRTLDSVLRGTIKA